MRQRAPSDLASSSASVIAAARAEERPLVLTAIVCEDDRRRLERVLRGSGLEVRGMQDAGEAAEAVADHDGPSILVIDAGLLHMSHDAQWRDLRSRHPDLGAVVRQLVREPTRPGWSGSRTALVHPDHDESLVEAVRTIGRNGAAA